MVVKSGLRVASVLGAMALALGATASPAIAQSARKVPYWASIAENEARMRVGPSLDYPASWIYRRRGLPVKVVQTLSNWRKIEDSTGTQGWMHVRLLRDTPTAIVIGALADMRDAPGDTASIVYRVEPGVVGMVSGCGNGWCAFDVRGQRGFIRTSSLWGAIN